MLQGRDEKRMEVNTGRGWWSLMKADLIKDWKGRWSGEDCGTKFRVYGEDGHWRRAPGSCLNFFWHRYKWAEHKLLITSADVSVSLRGWVRGPQIYFLYGVTSDTQNRSPFQVWRYALLCRSLYLSVGKKSSELGVTHVYVEWACLF